MPRTAAWARPFLSEVVLSRLILALSMAAGTFLRVWQINAMGYNTDEAVYAGQAAAIAGVPILKDIFPVFRAHPLLFQFVLSMIYKIQFSDLAGRLLAVVVGLGAVLLTYQIGKTLYGRIPGALAAAILALMPYHVIVSRQVLLDGPMVFFATLTIYMLARFGKSQKVEWLYAAGAVMGLTFLSKETSIILMGAIYTFLALSPEIRVRIRDLIVATVLMALVIVPFPITLSLAGGSTSGRNYLVWQLFRRPNHEWLFYPQSVPPAIGIFVIVVALLGLALLWREHSWREKLLLSWIIVPVIFFQIWPVKGFQYLLPIAPPLALLAGRVLGKLASSVHSFRIPRTRSQIPVHPLVSIVVTAAVFFTLGSASWQRIQPETSSLFLAGTGGVPGGREAGAWIVENMPANARIMTIGPSMANIVQFYGERKALGLATSPNPLHRNPSYEPILNPDLQIRRSELHYLVWDSFSAARTPFFADKLMGYVNKYNGRAVHTETISVTDAQGNLVNQPVIIIYEVHP
jgi:4-amino-4-deoxy-L-arabinose transferase-like glycosyltransferase